MCLVAKSYRCTTDGAHAMTHEEPLPLVPFSSFTRTGTSGSEVVVKMLETVVKKSMSIRLVVVW